MRTTPCAPATRRWRSSARCSIQAAELRGAHGVEVSARIGLHSGEVLVRAIGNDLSMDYDAIGPTVHLASRMEQLASPGTIRLTAATAGLAEGFVDLRALGQVPVKGLSQPVEAFDLVGRRCGAHAPAGSGRPGSHALRRPQGRTGGARSGARAGRGRPGPDRRPGRRAGRGQVAAVLRAHPQRADAPVAGAGRHLGLLGQRELLGAGGRSAQALLRHRAGRRPAAQRREGAGQGPAAGRSAAGRSCRRCSPCSICRSRTPPGRRSIRRSGAGALWTASRRCSCAKASGSRSPWSSRTCTGSTARPRRCSTAWSRACPPVASCCSSTTARNIGTAGAAGRITRSCASTRSRRPAPRSCSRACSAMRRVSRS